MIANNASATLSSLSSDNVKLTRKRWLLQANVPCPRKGRSGASRLQGGAQAGDPRWIDRRTAEKSRRDWQIDRNSRARGSKRNSSHLLRKAAKRTVETV